jgi:hypothetical protein
MKIGDLVEVSTSACPWMSDGLYTYGVITRIDKVSRRRGSMTSTSYRILLSKGEWTFSDFLVAGIKE